MENLTKGLTLFIGGILLILVVSVLLALPTQLLWNGCLVPAVDGINQIGFLQALGLNFLFSILFKSTQSNNKK